MRVKIFKLISVFLLSVVLLNISYAEVSATVDRTHLEKGETFELVLHLEDFDTQPNLDVLDKDFTVYNTSTSSKTTIVNNQKTSLFDMIVTLMPNKTGKLIIPAIQVGNEKTKPINIEVDKALSNDEQSKYQDLFAIGTLATNSSYVNVPVLYTLKLYYSTPILNLQPKAFNIRNSEIKQTDSRKTYQKRINGKMYDVVEESFMIIPHSTGSIKIPAIVLEATIPNAFGQLGTKKKFFSTESKILQVNPIPKDISIKDWFPSTDVQVSDSWSQTKDVKEGDLLTRTVKITAKGVLSSDIPSLEFKSSDGFNVYPEKPELKNLEKDGHLTGVATYKIGYMPVKRGKVELPEIDLKWFDVDTHKSKVASVAAKSFDVKKGNLANISFGSPGQSNAKVVEKVVTDSFWKNIALVFIVLWLITLVLLIKARLSVKYIRSSDHTESKQVIESSDRLLGLKDIKRACSNKDNISLQKAVISWASQKFDKQIFSLLEVTEFVPELNDILRKLNAAIYASKEFSEYKELLSLIKKAGKSKKSKSDKLIKGLYD